MLSERCKTAVRVELRKLDLHFKLLNLGEVEVMEDLTPAQRAQLDAGLQASGLELMADKKGDMLLSIKNALHELVYSDDDLARYSFPQFLAHRVGGDYLHMSAFFSEVQGMSLQQYFLTLKAERVKELIVDDGFSLTEIAFRLQYSSVGHLSNQFKKVTGFSPSHFKSIRKIKVLTSKQDLS